MRNLSAATLFKKTVDDFAVYLLQGFFFLQEKEKKDVNVSVVGFDGIVCETFLRDQIMEKELFCSNKLLWKGFASDGKLGGKEKTPDA